MANKKVSSKTHTQKQLDDYANQNNPNSKAYRARMTNAKAMKKKADRHVYVGEMAPIEWWCYSNPYDFD